MRTSQYIVYPRSLFLEQMCVEKRRAERTEAPLSIAVFDFGESEAQEMRFNFIKSINGKIRDTDILGYICENKICLLLPDTEEAGAQEVVKKIINGNAGRTFPQAVIASYPDKIFKNLSAENQDPQDSDPLFLEYSKGSGQFFVLLKRCFDILGSIVGILLLSPVMLITALAIKIDSPGAAIFKQIRLGRKGRPFVFYKFRSMYCKADDKIHRDYVTKLIKGNGAEINQGDADNPLYKIKRDPRVTKVGKFIRNTSIDELPQLFNVLKGDMSLVGPRPPLPYEVERYKPWHLRRVLEKRPGITGLWQVEGRSRTSFDDMVRLDVQYIRNWSFLLDLKILVKTVKVVIFRVGAV